MNADRARIRRPTIDGPARHEVVRLIADPAGVESGHEHVTAIETALEGTSRRWGLVEFVQAVRLGERFYLREGSTTAEVEPTVCQRCTRVTIAPSRGG